MGFRLERQDAQLREMTRALADIGKLKIFICVKISLCCCKQGFVKNVAIIIKVKLCKNIKEYFEMFVN